MTRFVKLFVISLVVFLAGCKPIEDDIQDDLIDDDIVVEEPVDENPVLQQADLKYAQVQTLLNELLPNELFDNYIFPSFNDDPDVSVIWLSSNSVVLTRTGIINRQSEDVSVTITANLKCYEIDYVYTKEIVVKALELKSLNGKNITAAYLYTSTYKKINDEDCDKIDIVNFSFASISNGVLNISSLMGKLIEVTSLRNKGIHVCLSVGGWGADGFSDAVLTSVSRKKLIDSIVNTLETYKFAGVDLDWEYPTTTAGGTITGRPEDKQNFTLFLQELRVALDLVNENYILSIAVPGTTYGMRYYEVDSIHQYLDYVHLMTYDLIDYSTSEISKHHTSLYASIYNEGDIKSCVDSYKAAGVPANKLVIGAAFYGHYGYVVDTTDGIGKTTTSGLSNSMDYTTIYNTYISISENSNYIYFDENAKASWYYDGNIFISYDDPISLSYKCDYVKLESLGGIMFWHYGGDQTGTLLDAIYQSFTN